MMSGDSLLNYEQILDHEEKTASETKVPSLMSEYTKSSPVVDKKNFLTFWMAHCLADLN